MLNNKLLRTRSSSIDDIINRRRGRLLIWARISQLPLLSSEIIDQKESISSIAEQNSLLMLMRISSDGGRDDTNSNRIIMSMLISSDWMRLESNRRGRMRVRNKVHLEELTPARIHELLNARLARELETYAWRLALGLNALEEGVLVVGELVVEEKRDGLGRGHR